MITNRKAWQTIVNPNNLTKVVPMGNNLAVVKNHVTSPESVAKIKVVVPKRYSFDDNGGGYEGL